jgi:phosphoglycolate phosphatase-like HAD superfamily hydrolase
MLYLFDIDGTLVDTGGAGMAALKQATREVFGDDGPELDLAGATDRGIVDGIHRHYGVDFTEEGFANYLAVYHERLAENLARGEFSGRVIDGVFPLLEHLAASERATLGLLTGNTAQGAGIKVRHFGLADFFAFGAYGCDHADRNRLGPIALQRAEVHAGKSFNAEETWIIGDTPKDIACAKAIGARCLAVATGRFSISQLQSHGADLVVASLEEAIGLMGGEE